MKEKINNIQFIQIYADKFKSLILFERCIIHSMINTAQ